MGRRGIFFFFYSLHFFLIFTEIGPLEFVGSKMKVFYATRAMRGYQKTRDFIENSGKSSENPNF